MAFGTYGFDFIFRAELFLNDEFDLGYPTAAATVIASAASAGVENVRSLVRTRRCSCGTARPNCPSQIAISYCLPARNCNELCVARCGLARFVNALPREFFILPLSVQR